MLDALFFIQMKAKKVVTAMISRSKGHESANSYLTEEERVMKEQSEFIGIYSSTIWDHHQDMRLHIEEMSYWWAIHYSLPCCYHSYVFSSCKLSVFRISLWISQCSFLWSRLCFFVETDLITHWSEHELLALSERIGTVNTGLTEEDVKSHLKTRTCSVINFAEESPSSPQTKDKTEPCTIC